MRDDSSTYFKYLVTMATTFELIIYCFLLKILFLEILDSSAVQKFSNVYGEKS